MARAASKGAVGPARIRFVMLDAEIPDGGDYSQITDAIQNALGSKTTVIQQRVIHAANGKGNGTPALTDGGSAEASGAEAEEVDEGTSDASVASVARAKRAPVKLRRPEIIPDLETKAPVSLVDYISTLNPTSESDKCLAVAAWFHLHRGKNAVTMDEVYTCFREIEWPSGAPDFGWPLRKLKQQQLVGGPKGSFEINNTGLDKVSKMKKAA
jgi:hypothetical protein